MPNKKNAIYKGKSKLDLPVFYSEDSLISRIGGKEMASNLPARPHSQEENLLYLLDLFPNVDREIVHAVFLEYNGNLKESTEILQEISGRRSIRKMDFKTDTDLAIIACSLLADESQPVGTSRLDIYESPEGLSEDLGSAASSDIILQGLVSPGMYSCSSTSDVMGSSASDGPGTLLSYSRFGTDESSPNITPVSMNGETMWPGSFVVSNKNNKIPKQKPDLLNSITASTKPVIGTADSQFSRALLNNFHQFKNVAVCGNGSSLESPCPETSADIEEVCANVRRDWLGMDGSVAGLGMGGSVAGLGMDGSVAGLGMDGSVAGLGMDGSVAGLGMDGSKDGADVKRNVLNNEFNGTNERTKPGAIPSHSSRTTYLNGLDGPCLLSNTWVEWDEFYSKFESNVFNYNAYVESMNHVGAVAVEHCGTETATATINAVYQPSRDNDKVNDKVIDDPVENHTPSVRTSFPQKGDTTKSRPCVANGYAFQNFAAVPPSVAAGKSTLGHVNSKQTPVSSGDESGNSSQSSLNREDSEDDEKNTFFNVKLSPSALEFIPRPLANLRPKCLAQNKTTPASQNQKSVTLAALKSVTSPGKKKDGRGKKGKSNIKAEMINPASHSDLNKFAQPLKSSSGTSFSQDTRYEVPLSAGTQTQRNFDTADPLGWNNLFSGNTPSLVDLMPHRSGTACPFSGDKSGQQIAPPPGFAPWHIRSSEALGRRKLNVVRAPPPEPAERFKTSSTINGANIPLLYGHKKSENKPSLSDFAYSHLSDQSSSTHGLGDSSITTRLPPSLSGRSSSAAEAAKVNRLLESVTRVPALVSPPDNIQGTVETRTQNSVSTQPQLIKNKLQLKGVKIPVGVIRRYVLEKQPVMVILRGLPGSGKSYLAKQLVAEGQQMGVQGVVLSTDDYFTVSGMYSFNKNILPEAHDWNKKRALQCMKESRSPIVIDNTNTTMWELLPYAVVALEHSYDVQLLEPDTPWRMKVMELHRKNSHGVGKEQIKRMKERWETFSLESVLKQASHSISSRKAPVTVPVSVPVGTPSSAPQQKLPADKQTTNSGQAKVTEVMQMANSGQAKVTEVKQTSDSGQAKVTEVKQMANSGQAKVTEVKQTANSGQAKVTEVKQMANSGQAKVTEVKQTSHSGQAKVTEVKQMANSGQAKVTEVKQTFDSGQAKVTEVKQTSNSGQAKVTEVKQQKSSNDNCTPLSQDLGLSEWFGAPTQQSPKKKKKKRQRENLEKLLDTSSKLEITQDYLNQSLKKAMVNLLKMPTSQVKDSHGANDIPQTVNCPRTQGANEVLQTVNCPRTQGANDIVWTVNCPRTQWANDVLQTVNCPRTQGANDIPQTVNLPENSVPGSFVKQEITICDRQLSNKSCNSDSETPTADKTFQICENKITEQLCNIDVKHSVEEEEVAVVAGELRVNELTEASSVLSNSCSTSASYHTLPSNSDVSSYHTLPSNSDVSIYHTEDDDDDEKYVQGLSADVLSVDDIVGMQFFKPRTALLLQDPQSLDIHADQVRDQAEMLPVCMQRMALVEAADRPSLLDVSVECESYIESSDVDTLSAFVVAMNIRAKDGFGSVDRIETQSPSAEPSSLLNHFMKITAVPSVEGSHEQKNIACDSARILPVSLVEYSDSDESDNEVSGPYSHSWISCEKQSDKHLYEDIAPEKYVLDNLVSQSGPPTDSVSEVSHMEAVDCILDDQDAARAFVREISVDRLTQSSEDSTTSCREQSPQIDSQTNMEDLQLKKKKRRVRKGRNIGPFIEDDLKMKSKTQNWSSFVAPSSGSSNSSGDSVVLEPGSPRMDTGSSTTQTDPYYFSIVHKLNSPAFNSLQPVEWTLSGEQVLASSPQLTVIQRWLLTADEAEAVSIRKIGSKVDQSTNTDETLEKEEVDLETLQSCFPEYSRKQLETTMTICQNDLEWVTSHLLDSPALYDMEDDDEDGGKTDVLKSDTDVLTCGTLKSTIKSLADMCTMLVRSANKVDADDLEMQVIQVGEGRLHKIEMFGRSRLHSLSQEDLGNQDYWPDDFVLDECPSSPTAEDLTQKRQNYVHGQPNVYRVPPFQRESTSQNSSYLPTLMEEKQFDLIPPCQEKDIPSYSSMPKSNDPPSGPVIEPQGKTAVTEMTIPDSQPARDQIQSPVIPLQFVRDLECMFGPLHLQLDNEAGLTLEESICRKIYNCLKLQAAKNILMNSNQKLQATKNILKNSSQKQLQNDEALARALQDEENCKPSSTGKHVTVSVTNKPSTVPGWSNQSPSWMTQGQDKGETSLNGSIHISGESKTFRPHSVADTLHQLRGTQGHKVRAHKFQHKMPGTVKSVWYKTRLRGKVDSLISIMEEEMAREEEQREQLRIIESTGDMEALATRIKRIELSHLFPSIGPDVLEDVFRSTGFSKEETIKVLYQFYNIPPAPMSKDKEDILNQLKNSHEDYQHVEDLYEDDFPGQDLRMTNDALRNEARFCRQLALDCQQQALRYQSNGMQGAALFYRQRAKKYREDERTANYRAAQVLFAKGSDRLRVENILDLHFYHLDEAINAVNLAIGIKEDEYKKKPDRKNSYLDIVTGWGRNSKHGKPKLKPAIIHHLWTKCFQYEERSPGMLRVYLGKKL